VTVALRRTFSSLAVPNYRRYFAGQVVSVSGNWMQTVAELWLVLKLTGSGLAVGLTPALQFLPILLAGAWGGVLADRLPKHRLLMTTQALMALPALALWLLYSQGAVEPWIVLALVLVRGSVNAIDNPTRQSFVVELVGADRLVNAVSLNSVVVNTGRIVGPAVAGVLIATAGVGPCFLVNALSFGAMLVALASMDRSALHASRPAARERGQVRSALRHVTATPELWIPLAMMVVVGTLSYNFQVLLPLLANDTWHGTASTYATLTVAMGAGSLLGALAAGHRGRVSPGLLVGAALSLGAVELGVAGAPTLALQAAALVPLGALTVTFATGVNSTLQLAVDPALRGRVMALYSIVFLGSTPIGSPIVGWLAQIAGPRAGLLLGALAALAAGLAARAAFDRVRAPA
jgi:predicted MFS family arabinose efflux permease